MIYFVLIFLLLTIISFVLTVYFILKGKNKMYSICSAFFSLVTFLFSVYGYFYPASDLFNYNIKNFKESVSLCNNDVIYYPKSEYIKFDQNSGDLYYSHLINVYLNRRITETEKRTITKIVDGYIVGEINGCINLLQIYTNNEEIISMNELCNEIIKKDYVIYASPEFPLDIYISDEKIGKNTLNTLKSGLWWEEAIGLHTALQYANKSILDEINVGVIDNGIDTEHEDLISTENNKKISFLDDFQTNKASDHGTHVVGIISAKNNEIGIRGISDNANVTFVSWEQNENNTLSSIEYIEIIKQLIEKDVKVINLSWNTKVFDKVGLLQLANEKSSIQKNKSGIGVTYLLNHYGSNLDIYDIYYKYLQKISQKTSFLSISIIYSLILTGNDNCIMVQASGNAYNSSTKNEGHEAYLSGFNCAVNEESFLTWKEITKVYFTNYSNIKDHIIIVGRTDNEKINNSYKISNRSSYGSCVDIYAPGTDIYGLVTTKDDPNSKNSLDGKLYGNLSGTSESAAMVSGSIALIWSFDNTMSPREIKNIIIDSSDSAIGSIGNEVNKEYPCLNVGKATEKIYSLKEK